MLFFVYLIAIFKTNVCQASAITSYEYDVIVPLSGEEKKSKVFEIGEVDIKYRKGDFQSGLFYTIKKSEVFIVKYSNGLKFIFGKEESSVSDNKDNKGRNSSTSEENKNHDIYPEKKCA
jgi:hypothetical protein